MFAILLDIDYVQAFKDGWHVIVDAPIQFFIFLALVVPGVWILVYRSFKHALDMEKTLKEGYREKLARSDGACSRP